MPDGRGPHADSVRLEGWNHVPAGYGATFDSARAPWWLRLWFRTPVVERFAYPHMVRRGFGWLTSQPLAPGQRREVPDPAWRLRPEDDIPPGTWNPLL
jgi:hypothetical protein